MTAVIGRASVQDRADHAVARGSAAALRVTARFAGAVLARTVLAFLVLATLPQIFFHDVAYYWQHAYPLSMHHLPYRDFLWEYPPVAAAPLLLLPLSHGSIIAFHLLFAATTSALEYSCLVVLRRTWPERARSITRWWYLLAFPLCAIAWFRLDFLSVLPATLAVASLERSRRAVKPIVVGIGAKLWPGVLVIALVARRQWSQLRAVVAVSVVGFGAWYAFSPRGVETFLRFRRGTGVQIESTLGAVLRLAGHRAVTGSGTWVVDRGHWGWVDPVGTLLTVAGALVIALGISRFRLRDDRMIEFLGACMVVMLLASRLFSPQFMVWLLPFVVLTAVRTDRKVGVLFAVAVLATFVTMCFYDQFRSGSALWSLIVVGRNATLAIMGWSMLRHAVTTSADRMRLEAADVPEVEVRSAA